MIEPIRIAGMSMISSLGTSLEDHLTRLVNNQSGIKKTNIYQGKFAVSSIDDDLLKAALGKHLNSEQLNRFEALAIVSIQMAINQSGRTKLNNKTQLFLATTKGDIDGICQEQRQTTTTKRHLYQSGNNIARSTGFGKSPIIICNACTSGVMAIVMACRLLRSRAIDQAVVCGIDLLSEFTVRGFAALHALDMDICKPFDQQRQGVNLGEAAATLILNRSCNGSGISILGGGISNDANHISGPSRTGAGLQQAVRAAVKRAPTYKPEVINAHGTATRYNDEMEAQAFHAIGFSQLPTMSFKGYWGHTLGAAGVIEVAGSALALQSQIFFASAGFDQHGLTLPLAIVKTNKTSSFSTLLKTSSGFGGNNAAIVMQYES